MLLNKTIIVTLIILLVVSLVAFYLSHLEDQSFKERGSQLIESIESYKQQNGKLPESVADLDVKLEMGQGPYYWQINDSVYAVYFNIGFDDIFVYHSGTEKWSENHENFPKE